MDWLIGLLTVVWASGLIMGFAFGQWFGSRNINVHLAPHEPDWDCKVQDAIRDAAIAGAACQKPGHLLQ